MTIETLKEIKFSPESGKEYTLATAPGVFTPNATTMLLIKAVKGIISAPARMLDLGCGTGVVGLALHDLGLVRSPLYASDLSAAAVQCSRENYTRYNCPVEVREGSLFAPWTDERFDVIIDDISGISQDVARVSPWFQGVPCETGKDGTNLVTDIIRQAPHYLNKGGHFFFPVLSLSNVELLLQTAKKHFATIEKVQHLDWPLPAELKNHMPLLQKLQAEGAIRLDARFGVMVCFTDIYCATKPIH